MLVSILVAVAITLALSWLAGRSSLGAVVAGLVAVAFVLTALLAVVRARSWQALGSFALSLALAGGIAWGLTQLGAAPAVVLPEPEAAAADSGATTPEVVPLPDPVDDCGGCPPSDDLTGLAVTAGEDAGSTTLALTTTGDGGAGDTLWIWFADAPIHPLRLTRDAGTWELEADANGTVPPEAVTLAVGERTVAVTIAGQEFGGVAVVTGGGDRIPDAGYAATDGAAPRAVRAGEGAESDALDLAVAEIQSAYPALGELHRELARTLLARQLVAGTATYDLELATHPGQRLVARIRVATPAFAQHLAVVDGTGAEVVAQSLHVGEHDRQLCTYFTDADPACEPPGDAVQTPVEQAVVLVRDPGAVDVEEVAARDLDGTAVRCLLVTDSPPLGPAPGETCSLADGTLAVNDNHRTGHRLVLVDRTSEVDTAAIEPPGDRDG